MSQRSVKQQAALKRAQQAQIAKGVSPQAFVKGTPEAKDRMAELRAMRQGGRKPLSQKAAQAAFNKYWNDKLAAASTPTQKRAVKAAWARDVNYGRPAGLRTTTSYRRNPGRLEFEGVDYGAKRYPKATGARLAALQRGQAALAQKRATGGLSRISPGLTEAGPQVKRQTKAKKVTKRTPKEICAEFRNQTECVDSAGGRAAGCGWTPSTKTCAPF